MAQPQWQQPQQKTAAPLPEGMGAPAPVPTAPPANTPMPVMGQPVYGQPVPQQPAVFHQPQYQPVGVPMHDWRYGMICPCCIPCDDCGLCCDTLWCGLCQISRQWAAIKDGRADDPNWSFCCTLCCLGVLVSLVTGAGPSLIHWGVTWYLRSEMRENANIEGNCLRDCCGTFCCSCCVLIQQHRELKARGMDPGYTCCSSSAPIVQQGYAADCGGRKAEP